MEPVIKTEFKPCEEAQDYFKVVLVGDSNVGKTTLLTALTGSGIIGRGYSASLEIIRYKPERTSIIGKIYDLRSQRYFPILHSIFYNNTKAAILVFDINNRRSYDSLPNWIDIIWAHNNIIPVMICGNKTDLRQREDIAQVRIEEALSFSKELSKKISFSVPYIELSAIKRIIAYSIYEPSDQNGIEAIYPTIDAFRQPFVQWLTDVVNKKPKKI